MIGVNEKAFNELVLKFFKVKEELNETFNNLNSIIDSLSQCYDSESSKELIENYRQFANANYSTILDNMSHYINDLKNAKTNYEAFDKKLLLQLDEESIEAYKG